MARRKHTACGGCRSVAFCRELEVMYRVGGVGPWTWIYAWTCAGCRAGSAQLLGQLFGQLVLWDG